MATPQEIQKLLNDLQSAYNKLGQTNPFANFDTSSITDTVATSRQLEAALQGVNRQLNSMSSELDGIVGAFKSTVNEISKSNNALNSTKNTFRGLTSLTQQLRNDQEGINKLNEKDLKSLISKVQAKKKELEDNKSQLEQRKQVLIEENRSGQAIGAQARKNREEIGLINNALQAVNSEYQEGVGLSQDLIEAAQKRIEQEKEIDKAMGLGGATLEGISAMMQGAGFGKLANALGLDEAQKKMRKTAEELTKGGLNPATLGDKFKVLGSGIKSMGASLAKALGPLTLLMELGKSLMEVNKETVELQKGMALSSTEANSFRANLGIAAANTGDINITTSKLLKSFSALNKQFGFITNFASQTLVTMTRLTDVVGVSSEAAGNLAAASTLTGKSFESNYKDVLGTSYELQRQEGVQFDLREILEETGKVTGTVRANLGANPANIAKAITQAKLFGASLQQVANAGKSLLDFESSITSELEAELLLGRDINLERARLAALNGDQVTLAKELRKEAGDYDDFMKMNVLQQEAIAKAMGMQSDELADILFKQDIQGKTAKELRALGKDELADRLEAQTVQDKFNASVEKLKEIFADVATALMPIFEVFGSIVQLVGLILSPFTAVINAATKFSPILGIIIGLLTAAATAAIVMNSALTFGVGTAIALAAAGGAIMLLNNNKKEAQPAGDINSPAKGKTQISTKEGGLFELSPNDDIIAAPGASAIMARASQPQQTTVVQQDNSESKRTNTLLEQILSKQGTIKLDSTDMGTAMSVNRYAIQ
jgi:hypothetical protein